MKRFLSYFINHYIMIFRLIKAQYFLVIDVYLNDI